jgi:hypothetical protein
MTTERPSPPWRWIAVGAAIPVALGFLEATQVYLGLELRGRAVSWGAAAASTLPSWAVLAVLLVPAVWQSHRHNLVTTPLRRWLVVHGLSALAFTVLHLGATAWVGSLLDGDTGRVVERFLGLGTAYFVLDLLTYAAIALVMEMVWRYRDDKRRELEAARLIANLAEMRYRALRNRLQPDFFFNTLNAVAGLVVRGEAERGVDALTALGALVRSAMGPESRTTISLGEEFELVDGYLRIQALRFPRRLTASATVPESLADRRVPAMSVFPVVERILEVGLGRADVLDLDVTARNNGKGVEVVITHGLGRLGIVDLFGSRRDGMAPTRYPGSLRFGDGCVELDVHDGPTGPLYPLTELSPAWTA